MLRTLCWSGPAWPCSIRPIEHGSPDLDGFQILHFGFLQKHVLWNPQSPVTRQFLLQCLVAFQIDIEVHEEVPKVVGAQGLPEVLINMMNEMGCDALIRHVPLIVF